jgi:SEC-C motif-containing protein
METCPCGSGAAYSACCEPVITGARPADTAEQLMRARYAAYVKMQMDFLLETTHPDHRTGYDHAGTKAWAEGADWQGLQIIATRQGAAGDTAGEVEFVARYGEKGVQREHHERAQFERQEGRWFFTDGAMVKPKPLIVTKIGRNDPCTCGSGLKYKKCCGK